jgi:hypothetical protein
MGHFTHIKLYTLPFIVNPAGYNFLVHNLLISYLIQSTKVSEWICIFGTAVAH